MDVLFFAFANDQLNPLPSLQKEANELMRLLSPGELQQRYIIYFDPFATREKIAYYLTQYKDRLALFHYSGHAERDALHTEGETSHAQGIAQLLGQCPKLKLVFLNGCSTQGQVEQLLEAGIPGVIGTSAPVEDNKATNFAIRFYQALSVQEKMEGAFQMAKGEVLTSQPGLDIGLHRGLASRSVPKQEATWGLFVQDNQDELLSWKLPEKAVVPTVEDFTPNELLINTLIEVLAPYNRDVRNINRDEEDGEEVDFADKRLAILNSMPAPIAEQLRKLMVPLADQDKGYNKVSQARAEQLVKTFNTIIELFAYTLLAQLWEAKDKKDELKLPEEQLSVVRQFFQLNDARRNSYDFIPLLRSIRDILHANEISCYIEEIDQTRENYQQDRPFFYACHYLDALKRRLESDELSAHEVPEACRQGEISLSEVFRELSFIAKYTMAAVRKIDVVKFRHDKTPTYRHSVVRLVKLMGGLEEKNEDMDSFMDSRSVLLVKKQKDQTDYLNLSPFIIDENAFDERAADISKVYFFYNYNRDQDKYCFRHAYKPNDVQLVVSSDKYDIIKVQFEAFAELFFNQSMQTI